MPPVDTDYDSIPRTYRAYLELMESEGEFLAIDDEIHWNLELGAILRRAAETLSPSPIFNRVTEAPGFRAAEFGMQKSGVPGRPWARLAPFIGVSLDTGLMEMQAAYIHSMKNNPVHPPIVVDSKDAPCKQNKWVGNEVDLGKLPAPLLHLADAERVLQTAGLNICQTPDGKWTNWSINRSAVKGKNVMAGPWLPTQHNGMIHAMWREKGKDMPFAIALGVPPVCAYQGASRIPAYVDEYDAASRMLNAPIEMVKCETNDLLVPASSEIVVEGTVSTSETLLEGPFGEYSGYHFRGKKVAKPKQNISCVTFRDNAILPVCSPGVPPDSTQISIAFCQSADIVIALKEAEFPIVDGIQTIESCGRWFVLRVKNDWHELTGWSLDEFINKIGHFISSQHIGGCFGEILVVGEDIDPDDPLAVTYALATRHHPARGTWFFPDAPCHGLGVESCHSTEDYFGRVGAPGQKVISRGGLAIYSCIGLQEHVGHPKPDILTFHRSWPNTIKDKVLANWDRWGFRTPDPVLQKHASQSTPWVYFTKSGEGETGRGNDH